MQLGAKHQEITKLPRRRKQIESINRICNLRVRWLCLLIHGERDEQAFEHFTNALEELLKIRRKGLRLAASTGEKKRRTKAPKLPDSRLSRLDVYWKAQPHAQA